MKQPKRKSSDFEILRLATERANHLISASAALSPEQLADLAAGELQAVKTDLRETENGAVRKLLLRFKRELKRISMTLILTLSIFGGLK